MRILYTCGREPEYPRNAVLQACLRASFPVIAATDRSSNLPLRYMRVAAKLLRAPAEYDLACVGFLGQPLVPLVRRITRRPILFDAFLSVYDTLCYDRRRFAPRSLAGRLAYWLDRASCTQADLVMLDTQAHARYFNKTFGVPMEKLTHLFVGCDENVFFPRPDAQPGYVLFYGSFLPLHGLEVIIRAAKLLAADERIRFRVIGNGLEYPRIRRLADQLQLSNMEFLPPVPLSDLPDQIAGAALCLGGHFSGSDKAQRVIAGKTFQCLAMGKPTIVGDNIANRELLTPGNDAWFCRPGDAEALAQAILALMNTPDLGVHLGKNARATFLARASIAALSRQVRQMVESLASPNQALAPKTD